MGAVQYFPVHCDICKSTCLECVTAQQVTTCRKCGAPATVVPGQGYIESDVELFERIEAATRAVAISRRTAERVVHELRDIAVRTEAPEAVLLRVLDSLPTLHFLLPALNLLKGTERIPLLRASGMVLSIMTARLRHPDSERTG